MSSRKPFFKTEAAEGVKLLLLVGVVCLIGYSWEKHKYNKIMKNKKIGVARVIDVKLVSKPTLPTMTYYFFSGTKKFEGSRNVDEWVGLNNIRLLTGQMVPVVYDSTDPKMNRLLLFKDDYVRYQAHYPENLRWLQQLLEQ